MTILDAVILGIVEGFTEFLPISSTAHLIIASELLRVPSGEFLTSFIISIQLGVIASIIFLYWKTLICDFETMKRVAAAFIPTALIGYTLYSLVKDVLLESLLVVAWALLIGGIALILFEWMQKGNERRETPLSQMPYSTAVLIGCIQAMAIVPGVSRAGATIVGGILLGLGRKEIVEFSFLLAIPTMLAATSYDLYKTGSAFAMSEWHLILTGFVVSFIAAYASVRFLVRFVATHPFTGFGWYRIALGGAILVFLFI